MPLEQVRGGVAQSRVSLASQAGACFWVQAVRGRPQLEAHQAGWYTRQCADPGGLPKTGRYGSAK